MTYTAVIINWQPPAHRTIHSDLRLDFKIIMLQQHRGVILDKKFFFPLVYSSVRPSDKYSS